MANSHQTISVILLQILIVETCYLKKLLTLSFSKEVKFSKYFDKY